MKQIVLLKVIPDLSMIEIDRKTRAPIIEGVKRKISEVDKRALEAAIRLKEKSGGEVIALSMGDNKTQTALLEALAMGADKTYTIIEPELDRIDTNATSHVLKAAIEKLREYDLIITGEMTLDSLSSQIGPRLAELLNLPFIAYVKQIDLFEGNIRATRDLEKVDEVVEITPPAIVSVVREINEPRIPSLLHIMRANKKPQTVWNSADLGLTPEKIKAQSYVEILDVLAPEVNRMQVRIEAETIKEAAAKLADTLKKEGII
jgi:electron transfer flavoprotein beta subunit